MSGTYGFDVDGLDLDPTFARIARGKLTRGAVYQADMTSFSLDRRYDAILCLFGSIGYVRTLPNLRRTLERFRAHLSEDGLILIEPWFGPGALESGYVTVNTARAPDVSVARMSWIEIEGRISRIRFDYLIGRRAGIEHFSEVHELGLFTTDEILDAFRDSGLEAACDPRAASGRGVFLAHAV